MERSPGCASTCSTIAGIPGGAIAGAILGGILGGGRGPSALVGAAGGVAIGAAASEGQGETRFYDVAVQFRPGTQQVFRYPDYAPFQPGERVVQTPQGLGGHSHEGRREKGHAT